MFKKTVFAMLLSAAFLVGCGGGDNEIEVPKERVKAAFEPDMTLPAGVVKKGMSLAKMEAVIL